jgi:hypothetical protein
LPLFTTAVLLVVSLFLREHSAHSLATELRYAPTDPAKGESQDASCRPLLTTVASFLKIP